ncbi:MAG TPA: TAXI family TRAP transporter solute-binding subunit [Azospirillum sp.]|nr:TAXI family TRAP transporter solute-binding subunit [Azospirillum sp.]
MRLIRLCAMLMAVVLLGVTGTTNPARAADGKERANAGVVGLVSGGVEGTYVRIASDLAAVLDDADGLRVLPMLGKGSIQNIADILYLRGIDIGIVQGDALAYAQRERLYPGIENRLRYITRLYNEELHVLARSEIQSFQDLAGRKVNFDVRGSGTFITASLVFDMLGVAVEPVMDDQAMALEKLKRGEIAALAYVAGKPTRLFQNLRPEDGLHFVSVPLNARMLETYLPSRLTNQDYPQLILSGEAVDTLAIGAVMAVFNWDRSSERHRKVARFVEALFSRFADFQKPPRHAKWREVNLAAEVPGWRRFESAEAWLKRAAATAETGDASRSVVAQQPTPPNGRRSSAQ